MIFLILKVVSFGIFLASIILFYYYYNYLIVGYKGGSSFVKECIKMMKIKQNKKSKKI